MARTKRGLERSQMLRERRHGASVLPAAETTQRYPDINTKTLTRSEDGHELNVPAASVPPVVEKTRRLTEQFSVPGDLIPDFRGFVTLRRRMPTELSHMTFSMLSDANPAGREALESQLESKYSLGRTVAVMVSQECLGEDGKAIRKVIAWSVEDKSRSELPPIPNVKRGFPPCCKSISLHGKYMPWEEIDGRAGAGSRTYSCWIWQDKGSGKKCGSMVKPRQQGGVAAIL